MLPVGSYLTVPVEPKMSHTAVFDNGNLFPNTLSNLFLIPNEEDPIHNIIKTLSHRYKPFASGHPKPEMEIPEPTASWVFMTRKSADASQPFSIHKG